MDPTVANQGRSNCVIKLIKASGPVTDGTHNQHRNQHNVVDDTVLRHVAYGTII